MEYCGKNKHKPHLYLALLNELLGRTCQAIVLLDSEAEILYSTESIKFITGYNPEELTGKTVFDFFQLYDQNASRQRYKYLTEFHETASSSLLQIRNKDGNLIWIDVTVKNMMQFSHIQSVFVLLKRSVDANTEERKLAQAMTNAKEEEKEFLATELHDNVNQIITATKLLVDTARFRSNKEELLEISSANLQLVSDEIRKLSYSMVSYDLRDFGLAFAVKSLLTILGRASSISFQTTMDDEAVALLINEQQLHVYRIIQESINNIIRHSDASDAQINLRKEKDLIHLVITDNGKGFSVNRIKPGIGLGSITNRVKLLQGYFHVRAPKGQGTTIEIHFPV